MNELEKYTEIGRLMFKLAQFSGVILSLRVTSNLEYQLGAEDRGLEWNFADSDGCLAFLENLDGNPARIQAQVKAARIEALERRRADDQAEIDKLNT